MKSALNAKSHHWWWGKISGARPGGTVLDADFDRLEALADRLGDDPLRALILAVEGGASAFAKSQEWDRLVHGAGVAVIRLAIIEGVLARHRDSMVLTTQAEPYLAEHA